jgi:hypothetical protein
LKHPSWGSGVARWYIFKPKIPIWVNFGGPLNGKCWFILRPFGIFNARPLGKFYGHLVYFTAMSNILIYLHPFGIFYGIVMVIWYISPRFCIFCQEKSGLPVVEQLWHSGK